MNCPSCNVKCSDDSNFCHNCGQSLKPYSQDNNQIPAKNVFSQSNSSISQALKRLMPTSYVEKLLASDGRKSEGERRVVTILFSDIKGSTAFGENLDPEEVLNIMNGAFEILIQPIMKYEGTLARLMGDAILAFFGAPIAHEDDPQRACRAALEIIEGAKRFGKKLEDEKGIEGFSVRVGINTGLVVVAEVGADLRVEYTAMGDAVNVASRMESAAEPGTILITEETTKLLTNHFKVESIGPIKVKGKTNLVNSFKLISENLNKSSASVENNYKSPIIGRDAEIKNILDAFSQVGDGRGKVISIIGECGVGKTRLVSEIRKLTFESFCWIEAKSLTYRQNNSYWLIKNLLRDHLTEDAYLSADHLSVNLFQRIQNQSSDKFSDIYPFLSYLLDLPIKNNLSVEINIHNAESLKGQLHFAVKEYFKDQTHYKPIVLLLEDLQWCDSASVALITELFALINEYPMIILMTFRKNENEIWAVHENNRSMLKNDYQTFFLNSLSECQGAELIKNLSSDLNIPKELGLEILIRTEGNPFFIEEVLKSFVDSKLSNNKRKNINANNELGFEIPNLLQGVIMARLDYLSSIDKLVLQSASVIGRIFSKKLLVNVLINSLNEKEIEESLKDLVKKEFIDHQHSDMIKTNISYPEQEFIFKQSLIQEVAYSSLLFSNRQKIHLEVGEAIERLYTKEKDEIADSIGVHFEKGKLFSKSIYYYKKAADRAKNIFANKEAIHFYQKILLLSKDIQNNKFVLAEVYESLGDVYFITSDYTKSIEVYQKVLETSELPKIRATIHQKCGHVYEHWGQYEKSIESYNNSLTTNQDDEDLLLEARCYLGLSMVYYRQGNLQESLLFCNNTLELLKNSQNNFEISETYNNLGIIYSKLDNLEKSSEYHLNSLKIRQNIGDVRGQAASYNNLGYLSQLQNKNTEAIEYYNRSEVLCEKVGNLHGLAKIYDNLSQIYIAQDKNETAMSYSLKAMEIIGRIASDSSDVNQHVWLQSGVW